MSKSPFNDAVLSAILDGEADPEIVASVDADEVASERLEAMRSAVQVVAAEPAPATAERRASSIAAAMAAATPASPEVTSLAAARHEKAEKKKRSLSTGWIAAVAAAVAFVVAIPIALSLGGDTEVADTATSADAAEESVEASSDDSDDDAADMAEDEAMQVDSAADADAQAVANVDEAMADGASDDAADSAAMEEQDDISGDAEDPDAEASDVVVGEDEPDDVADAAPIVAEPVDVQNFTLDELPLVTNATQVGQAITDGEIVPLYSATDIVTAGVRQDCFVASDAVTNPAPYALVTLSPFGGADRLIVVEFADNGVTRALDAEDCALLG